MTSTIPQYVELFHLLFLNQFGRKVDKRLYALKGGGNLRFFLKSFRYSEDIDLDVATIPPGKLRATVNGILTSRPFQQILEIRGIRIDRWSAPKQTDTTQRWKVGLAIDGSDLPLHTKIEFSRRGITDSTLFQPIDPEIIRTYQLSPILTNHYDSHAAFEQKIEAVLTRSTTQARDIFDLNLLLNSGVDRTVAKLRLKSRLAEAQSNILAIPFGAFKSQVLSFLLPDHRASYDSPSVWDDMVLKVVEALKPCG